jgi:Rrf2 family iron-sulfur cluster assembly transcriptional regulator
MRLSTGGRYALRAMVDLAQHEEEGAIARKEIARRQGISSDYLAQLFAQLREAGLVQSVMGPGGGYRLARHSSQITAGDVLRAVQEPLHPAACLEGEACDRLARCSTYSLWAEVGRAVAEVLDGATLEMLSASAGELHKVRTV